MLFAEAVAEAKAALTSNTDLIAPNPPSPILPSKQEGEEKVDTYTGQMVFLTTQNDDDTGEGVTEEDGKPGVENNMSSSSVNIVV